MNDVTLLLRLAAQASAPKLQVRGTVFPDHWDIIEYFTTSASMNFPASQGFLARGNIDTQDPTSDEVLVLALGINWAAFIKGYQFMDTPSVSVPVTISGCHDVGALFESLFVGTYQQLRPFIWRAYASLDSTQKSLPLYLCGHNLGAPLAQLAALDLRPANEGPGREVPPLVQTPCHVFSAPNVANSTFIDYYNATVVDASGGAACFTHRAATSILAVDNFPAAPQNADYGILGQAMPIDQVSFPARDLPWQERGAHFYLATLGATLIPGPDLKSDLFNPPVGYDQSRAYTLASVLADAYHEAQHPGSGEGYLNYVLVATVSAYGSPYVFLYTYNNQVVVAFRGAITWQETQHFAAATAPANGTVVPNSIVSSGIKELYQELRPTLLPAIQSAVAAAGTNNPATLFFTGHDIGGGLANLATIDLELNPLPQITVVSTYTFGALAIGDFTFCTAFNEKAGPKCYQTIRIYDGVAAASFSSSTNYELCDTPFLLNGQLALEDNDYHSLYGYLHLLDPSPD
jgi:hypothetical protein